MMLPWPLLGSIFQPVGTPMLAELSDAVTRRNATEEGAGALLAAAGAAAAGWPGFHTLDNFWSMGFTVELKRLASSVTSAASKWLGETCAAITIQPRPRCPGCD